MAAYAALVSLMNIMDQIQIHPRISTCFNKNHLESLGGTVGILLYFVESYNGGGVSKQVVEDLEGQIASAAHKAEDVIESHVVDLILAGSANTNMEDKIASAAHAAENATESQVEDQYLAVFTKRKGGLLQKMMRCIREMPVKLPLPCVKCNLQKVMCNLEKVTKDMDSIKEKVMRRFKDRQIITCSTPPPSIASARPATSGKPSMVGFDDYLYNLVDRLTGQQSHQLVIPIIGMGGIGKTTLARNAFENPLIKQHFDVCSWVTISQNYGVRDILLQLLPSKEDKALDEHQLGERLHKFLFNRRYIIVLDDVWGIEVWDDIKFFFPDNNNGSRIVVTTRLLNIVLHFGSSYHTVNLLDENKSWNLFCQEAFGDEDCPAELAEVGRKICENCKGLPLSIVVMGGFLRMSSKSREHWEGAARDTFSILNSEGEEQCMNILSLSYNHLPAHLKPCFPYMGIFPEDDEISVSVLIKLWVAEGFLKQNDAQSLEEVAEGYIKDLSDRNLILVNRWGSTGKKIRACSIHDLLRELCLIISKKENFCCVMKLLEPPSDANRARHIVFHEIMQGSNVLRGFSYVSSPHNLTHKGFMRFDLKLLRVLRAVDQQPETGFLEADLNCVNLQCLDHRFVRAYNHKHSSLHIPKKISLLWNLQTVRIEGYHQQLIAPSDIWEMVQLRHLQADSLYVPDPPPNDRVDTVLPNLQTLWNALNFRLSEEVCKRIPNVKKLGLLYSELPQRSDAGSYYCAQNLNRFHKLESLALKSQVQDLRPIVLNMTFPNSLKKLTLSGGHLYWEDMEMIGSLPHLEVLKVTAFSMIGSEWNPVEGQFLCLKVLQIHSCQRLTKWNADDAHFPVLEKLYFALLFDLDEIPSGIGEIPTLRIISLYNCDVHYSFSAVKILEEQESFGNDDLRVEVGFAIHNEKDRENFREMMEADGFTSNNLHIKRSY